MHSLLQPLFIIVLFVLVRCADIAIGAARGRDTIRAICYGIVAILALIYIVVTLLGIS
jgi:hypothetical protein